MFAFRLHDALRDFNLDEAQKENITRILHFILHVILHFIHMLAYILSYMYASARTPSHVNPRRSLMNFVRPTNQATKKSKPHEMKNCLVRVTLG